MFAPRAPTSPASTSGRDAHALPTTTARSAGLTQVLESQCSAIFTIYTRLLTKFCRRMRSKSLAKSGSASAWAARMVPLGQSPASYSTRPARVCAHTICRAPPPSSCSCAGLAIARSTSRSTSSCLATGIVHGGRLEKVQRPRTKMLGRGGRLLSRRLSVCVVQHVGDSVRVQHPRASGALLQHGHFWRVRAKADGCQLVKRGPLAPGAGHWARALFAWWRPSGLPCGGARRVAT